MSIFNVNYYAKPEGEDFFNKMVATNTYAAIAGIAWSATDVMMLSHTKGYIPTIARFAYNTGPMMGMASTFTLTTYALTNIRGKDDRINYFLGGFAAGGIYGAWKRNHIAGMFMGLALGIAGLLKKTSIKEGWQFFPPHNYHAYMHIAENDFTLMSDPSKDQS